MTTLTGLQPAFSASGGFILERGFSTIKMLPQSDINVYDVTNAIQLTFDVKTFNQKLGLTKNESNVNIMTSNFNYITDTFPVDSISLSATEFVNGLTASSVLSVGSYSTMYSDFISYVSSYFGNFSGFETLFDEETVFSLNDGIFDADAFIKLITQSDVSGNGSYVSAVSGQITISNINNLLRRIVDANLFGNRTPTGTNGTAADPSNNTNYGVADGFIAGDLIWIPEGTTVNLSIEIDAEMFLPINNIGPSLVQNTNYVNGNFSASTNATTTNIQRTLKAPMLIKLVNATEIVNTVSFQMAGVSASTINTSPELQNIIVSSVQSTLPSDTTVTFVSAS